MSTKRLPRGSPPNFSRSVMASARPWHGCRRVDSRLMIGFSQYSAKRLITRSCRTVSQLPGAREGPHAEHVGVPAEHAGGILDVLDRRAVHHGTRLGLERPAALARLEHDAVPAVQEHRGLEAGARAKARVHEDHRHDLPLEPTGDLAPLHPVGEVEQRQALLLAPRFHRQEVTLHCGTDCASTNSLSARANCSGGRASASDWPPRSARCRDRAPAHAGSWASRSPHRR